MTATSIVIVFGLFLLAILLSLAYFRRYRMPQPPIGRMNLWDVALTMIVIVIIPYLHLLLPSWFNTVFLSLVSASLFYFLLEPVVRSRPLRWAVTLALVGIGIAAATLLPGGSPLYTAVNNVLIVLSVVAISNVWVQSGSPARDIVILAIAIAVYDFVFTGRLPVTADLFAKLDNVAFAPVIMWRDGALWPAIGLGDTLMSASFVVAMFKAFGGRAALVSFAAMALALPLLFILPQLDSIFITDAFPAMVILGPAMLLVYILWRRRYGPERTMREYELAAPGDKRELEAGVSSLQIDRSSD
jgi:hypothetical protein